MISQALKESTAQAHQDVETYNPLMQPHFSTQDYASYLGVLAGYYKKLEARFKELSPQLPPELSLASRLKLDSLLKDLQQLQAPLIEIDFSMPSIKSRAQFWGHFYVLEGSTLGGQIISRRLAEKLNLEPSTLNFFSSYKEKTGPMWKSFIEVLNSQNFTPEETQEVISSAQEGFHFYGKALQQVQKSMGTQL